MRPISTERRSATRATCGRAGLHEPGGPGYNTLSAHDAFLARKGGLQWDGNTADIFNDRGGSGYIIQLDPPSMNRLLAALRRRRQHQPTYPLYHGSFADVLNPTPSDFDPLGPDYVQHVVPTLKQYEAVGVQDPAVGFYSETAGRQGADRDAALRRWRDRYFGRPSAPVGP